MGVAVATEAEDTRVSAAAPISAELVAATVEPELAMVLSAMGRGITHPESQRDATVAMAATGKDTMYREARLAARFIVLLRDRKVKLLLGSLLDRQIIQAAIMSLEINPGLALRTVSPVSSTVIIRAQLRMSATNAAGWLPAVQRGLTTPGRGRI